MTSVMDKIRKAAPAWKPPAGFVPIPGSKHGGYHKRGADGKWVTKYAPKPGGEGFPMGMTVAQHSEAAHYYRHKAQYSESPSHYRKLADMHMDHWRKSPRTVE